MFEFIVDFFLYWIWEGIILTIGKIIIGIGSIIFSIFSLFKIKPKEHYNTESIDKKIGMFWTGLITIILVVLLIIKLSRMN